MATLGGDPGSWATWGHDTPSETGPQDGWQVSQGKVVHGGQTTRARELGRAGPVRLDLQEEAEQEELLLGFGEEGVWHLGRWEAL